MGMGRVLLFFFANRSPDVMELLGYFFYESYR